MRRSIHTLLALACAAALTGCGDGIDPEPVEDPADPAARVEVAGTDQLVWKPPRLAASPGTLDIRIDCDLNIGHQLAIEGVQDGQPIATCGPAGTGAGSVDLEPGTYTFFCAVPGHREEGMVGELVIE